MNRSSWADEERTSFFSDTSDRRVGPLFGFAKDSQPSSGVIPSEEPPLDKENANPKQRGYQLETNSRKMVECPLSPPTLAPKTTSRSTWEKPNPATKFPSSTTGVSRASTPFPNKEPMQFESPEEGQICTPRTSRPPELPRQQLGETTSPPSTPIQEPAVGKRSFSAKLDSPEEGEISSPEKKENTNEQKVLPKQALKSEPPKRKESEPAVANLGLQKTSYRAPTVAPPMEQQEATQPKPTLRPAKLLVPPPVYAPPPPLPKIRKGATRPIPLQDHEAAIEFLKVLRRVCDRHPWPSNQREMQSFLVNHRTDFPMNFQGWFHWVMERTANNPRKREVVRRLVQTFIKGLGCMTNGSNMNKLIWNVQRVNALCNRHSTETLPSRTGSFPRQERALNGVHTGGQPQSMVFRSSVNPQDRVLGPTTVNLAPASRPLLVNPQQQPAMHQNCADKRMLVQPQYQQSRSSGNHQNDNHMMRGSFGDPQSKPMQGNPQQLDSLPTKCWKLTKYGLRKVQPHPPQNMGFGPSATHEGMIGGSNILVQPSRDPQQDTGLQPGRGAAISGNPRLLTATNSFGDSNVVQPLYPHQSMGIGPIIGNPKDTRMQGPLCNAQRHAATDAFGGAIQPVPQQPYQPQNMGSGPFGNTDETPMDKPMQGSRTASLIGLVDSMELLNDAAVKLASELSFSGSGAKSKPTIAIDCTGTPDQLHLLAIATLNATYIFDCIKLNPSDIYNALANLLNDVGVLKVFHGLNRHSHTLALFCGLDTPLTSVFDTQLAMEALTGDPCMGFMEMLGQLKLLPLVSAPPSGPHNERPLPQSTLMYFGSNVQLLLVAEKALEAMDDGESFAYTQIASDERAVLAFDSRGSRRVGFDITNSCALASLELLAEGERAPLLPLVVSNGTATLLQLLPDDLAGKLSSLSVQKGLAKIELDYGRKPIAWVDGRRMNIGKDADRVVTTDDLRHIEEAAGGFEGMNRARLDDHLHRIAAIRDVEGFITGITIGVGRHVTGGADLIADLVYSNKSILFLGDRGSGKTTVLREISRLLSSKSNVAIVDSKNEIAGNGDIPHPSVGLARRMMVALVSLDEQGKVMMECVQDHSPQVMVIDELGVESATEMQIAQLCKQRGTRLMAGAGGNLRKLIQDTTPKMHFGVGNTQATQCMISRIVGIFDAVVELQADNHHEWRVVENVGDAVQQMLSGKSIAAQERSRNPDTGAVLMDTVRL